MPLTLSSVRGFLKILMGTFERRLKEVLGRMIVNH